MKWQIFFCAIAFRALVVCAEGESSPQAIPLLGWKAPVQPQICASETGELFLAFGEKEINAVGFTRSTNSGKSFSPPIKIATLPGLALGMRRGPRIFAYGKKVVITAISHEDGNMRSWFSGDDGKSWGAPTVVNDNSKSAREGLHSMGGNGAGAVMCVWLDLRSGSTELWAANSENGGENWGANFLIYKSASGHICECCNPVITFDNKGTAVVMWRNFVDGNRDMYWAKLQGDKVISPPVRLGDQSWKLNACPMDGGHLLKRDDGQTVSVWRREGSVYFSGVGAPELKIGEGVQPVLAKGRAGERVFWQKGANLYSRSLTGNTELFALNAGFLSAVSIPGKSASFAVWEASLEGKKAIFGQWIE